MAAAEGFRTIKLDDLTFSKHGDLGAGGFGGVRLATHKQWGEVAVKELHDIT